MAHNINFTPQELELVFFAVIAYSHKFKDASESWARTQSQRDYIKRRSDAISELKDRIAAEYSNAFDL